jgi:predicted AlkP superfamily pyrophosphatase or phosphodiesterase
MTAKRILVSCAAIFLGTGGMSCASAPAPEPAGISSMGPTLVVLVVVDQLRADLLDKYGDFFTGGFRRLRTEGHSFVNAGHDHGVTVTASGHATLSTGVYPSRHGVVSNLWQEMSGNRWVPVENIDDTTVKIVGVSDARGASPVHLMRSGFAEWLVRANPRSKVASVSGKDRGAIQPAAHVRGAYVYWFEGAFGRFVTSSYYRNRDPQWVTAFNAEQLQKHSGDSLWSFSGSEAVKSRSNRDTLDYEADGVRTFFPHTHAVEKGSASFWVWWENTPFVDALTIEMAEQMVKSLDLGRDDAPDFLNVSVSATDRIGHRFGPLSREQMDNLLRLDRELGEFFDFLDRTVGKNRWTVVLSADHGVMDSPEDLAARGDYGHRLTPAENRTFDSLRAVADSNPDKRAASRDLAASLKKIPLVADAWTTEELARSQQDSFAVLMKRSMYPGREAGRFSRQGVEFRYRPGIYGAPRGSGHGQPYWFDRHVPLIFMGPGIVAAQDPSRAATVDFAPTVASLLDIAYPRDLDGRVLGLSGK